jgi:hypothetical protein
MRVIWGKMLEDLRWWIYLQMDLLEVMPEGIQRGSD